ncbi:amidase domain-containing protein [Salinibacillus xinjiangensis]|uniref:Putative amidase domain-containing protein n=1 Tax=Salinibacillus xinjiangensis TaxID=1229268 RepID=A0A6G1X7B4_9BACI|nr:amidase domain-containing protein [Salinibacillus xinjiangensis]MRG86819.1 hypothetical protein [Salinibacillus xinjiangensis]
MKRHLLEEEWEKIIHESERDFDWWNRKKESYEKRGVQLLRVTGDGQPYQRIRARRNEDELDYTLHLQYLLKQDDHTYMEEEIIPGRFTLKHNHLIQHDITNPPKENQRYELNLTKDPSDQSNDRAFNYDRRKAVQYAERWWNGYNPAYRKFEDDCTSFISQCLRAGGAPMWGGPNRSKGWWYQGNNWSYSWSVAHALRWYLSGSKQGLTAKEVDHAENLLPGDVICYDFEGDGRWNHNTIVVAKDGRGEPLVNAHTVNSRHRYWRYEDSTAWTPNCQYKFFRIGE